MGLLNSYDTDEWELVSHFVPCWCTTAKVPCNGTCMGMGSQYWRPRPPEEVLKIREAKRLAHEENILRQADAIRARRYQG